MMFLHEKLNIGYIADLKVQILELPYAGEVSMFLLLPDGIAESSTGLELVRIPTSVVLNAGAKLTFAHVCCCCCYLVAKSRPTLWDPLDFSPPYSSVPGISQARLLEQVAISSPGDLPDPRIKPMSPALAGGFFFLSLSHLGSPCTCPHLRKWCAVWICELVWDKLCQVSQ